MRRIFILIGVLTLIHQYIWYQRTPKVPTDLVAPEKMTVWANAGGIALTDTTLLVSLDRLKQAYGARYIHLNLIYSRGEWIADPVMKTPLTEVTRQFPFLNYWFTLSGRDTSGLEALAHIIRSRELERQIVISGEDIDLLVQFHQLLPNVPRIMPAEELERLVSYRKLLLLPFFHTTYDVALVPLDTTRGMNQFTTKFIRSLGHLGIPVWADGVQNLSQILWLEERQVKSVRMDRVDLALLPRATLFPSVP